MDENVAGIPDILRWVADNWAAIVAAIGVVVELIPGIKVNPLTAIFKWIGERVNADTNKRIDALDEKFAEVDSRLDEQAKQIDMQRIANIRSLILDFANSCRNGVGHSHEEYLHVLDENGNYEALIRKYDIKNSVYKESYDYILRKYRECMDNNAFLA